MFCVAPASDRHKVKYVKAVANKSTQYRIKYNSGTLRKNYRLFYDAVSTDYLDYCGNISQDNRVSCYLNDCS